jgi:predicted HicB family RNase H-like nuclease
MPDRKRSLGKLTDGTELTEQLADTLAEEAERGYDLDRARRVGRPSLDEGVSPRVNFRVTAALHDRALKRAEREGKTVSQLAREALEKHLSQ